MTIWTCPTATGSVRPCSRMISRGAGFTTGTPWAELVSGNLGPRNINVKAQVADPASLLHAVRRMISVRKEHPVLGEGDLTWVETNNPVRGRVQTRHKEKSLVVVSNLTGQPQSCSLESGYLHGYRDLIENRHIALTERFSLNGHAFLWLQPEA